MSLNSFQRSCLQSAIRYQGRTPVAYPIHRSFSGLSQAWPSLSPILDDRREKRRDAYALPRISLPGQHSLSLPSRRYHSSPSNQESTNVPTSAAHQPKAEESDKPKKRGHPSFKEMISKYGYLFVGTHFTVYLATLAALFYGIESGALDPAYAMSWISSVEEPKTTIQYVSEFMDHYSWTRQYAPTVEAHPEYANFLFAWFVVKFTEPIRFPITMAVVPVLVRFRGTPDAAKQGEEAAANKPSSSTSTDTSDKTH